jgi:peptidyl-prolyl cis-trans isomerase C
MRRSSKKKNSTKVLFAVAIAAALIFAVSGYFLSHRNEVVVAKVNDTKILKSDIERKLQDVFEGQGQEIKIPAIDNLPKEVFEILVKEIYLEKELTAKAKNSKAAKTEEIKNKIADSKDKILRQAYVNSLLEEEVSDAKVNAKYEELSNEVKGKKEYLVAHIVVKTKAEAEKIEKETKSKKFADLAKKYSIDPETANKGGELGYVVESNMIKEIADAISKLKTDEISSPIETKFGWHIIKILDVRDAEMPAFDAMKENIRSQLIQDKINEINSGITKDSKIQILIQLKEPEKKPVEENKAEEKTAEPKANSEATPKAEESSAKVSEETVAEDSEENTEEEAQNKTDEKKSDAHKKSKKHHKKSR